ncbi:heparinase II/III domain-containing protein [Algibacillus agarilyticus]|uniref:heparinase II/III domain-containing protein n=1 Tax=Algibacillus agarilyticus TaxID=2234133 RepID=UPI001E32DC87|nr:heparinase II/III family protein [Algibacillus agarilyticus]
MILLSIIILAPFTLQASEIERPSIWVKNTERQQILDKIKTEPWAQSLFNEMKNRVDSLAVDDQQTRRTHLESLPLIWFKDKTRPPTLPKFRVKGGGTNAQRIEVVKALQDGVDCGVLYYLTQENRYAACGADRLYTVINALKSMEVQRKGPMNSSWMFPTDHLYEARVIGAQLPVIYDFVYNYLKSGGQVYDLASAKLTQFNFDDAQTTFKTYIWLALNKGLLDSNWPVLESSSLVHNILALDSAADITKNLPFYTHVNTKHQASLKKIAESFENEGDIWPESMGYSRHVASFSIYLMTLLDRYDSSLKLGSKHPNIPAAFMSYYNLKYPNEEYPFIGDGHREYEIEYSALEMSFLLAQLNNNQEQISQFGNYLSSSLKKGVYDRGHLHKRSYKAAPYYTPTQLLWFSNKINSNADVDVAPPRPRTKRLEFAGMNIQRNISSVDPVKNSLMAFVAGGSYIHGHASGMDMELYGQGYVLGVDGGKSKYRTDLHENYHRIFAAHNTVISNGASASKGGWINLGINKVEAIALEPNYGEPGVSPNHSFTTSAFYDEFNLVAPAKHQRTMALIKVSDTQGYYLDIFRAKSDYAAQYHDYLYHNIGEKLVISSNNQAVKMKSDPERYKASAELPWTLQRKYRHPGWHFFENVKTHAKSDQPFEATFTAAKLTDQPISMRAIMPAGLAIEVTQATAPKAYGAAKPYNKKPIPTLALRKQGDAWRNPFAVVYESTTGNEGYVIESTERLMAGDQFKGVKVTLNLKGHKITQYVLTQENINDVYEDKTRGIYFKGHFAVITVNAAGKASELYIGNGDSLTYKHEKLSAPSKTKSAYRVF